jgi:hypothetical protein
LVQTAVKAVSNQAPNNQGHLKFLGTARAKFCQHHWISETLPWTVTITSRSCILASTSVCFSGKLLLFKLVRCTVVFAFHFASSLAEVTVSKKAHYAKPMGSSLPCLHFPVGAIGGLF